MLIYLSAKSDLELHSFQFKDIYDDLEGSRNPINRFNLSDSDLTSALHHWFQKKYYSSTLYAFKGHVANITHFTDFRIKWFCQPNGMEWKLFIQNKKGDYSTVRRRHREGHTITFLAELYKTWVACDMFKVNSKWHATKYCNTCWIVL